jgi:hypothetical protein
MRSIVFAMLVIIGSFAAIPAKADFEDTARSMYIGVGAELHENTHVTPAERHGRRHARASRARSFEARTQVESPVTTADSGIVAIAARYLGARNPTGFRGPWCKAFANMVARQSGHYVQGSLRARDTGAMGQRVAGPVPGAYRVTRGHVSIVASVDGGSVTAISGNNGHGRVGYSHYAARGAAYYMPI